MADEETKETTDQTKENEREDAADDNMDEGSQSGGSQRPTKKLKPQMLCELLRVRQEMIDNSTLGRKSEVKPYTPDVSNELKPYYDKYLVDYMINDQGILVPRPGYGQRPTSLGLVDDEVSWRMDHFPGPLHDSILPRYIEKQKSWSKNAPGSQTNVGSTRLPPIPKVVIPNYKKPQYQHFNMNYGHVQPFRAEVKDIQTTLAKQRAKYDYDRTMRDWERMNLMELKQLPAVSRYNVKKAVVTYLGTSKGSNRAVREVVENLKAPEKAYAN